jgi:hypothetical protein
MKEKRNKYDIIIILILIAVALLVGAGLGYEKGVNICKNHYNSYISKMCYCFSGNNYNYFNVSRSIPDSLFSNISVGTIEFD